MRRLLAGFATLALIVTAAQARAEDPAPHRGVAAPADGSTVRSKPNAPTLDLKALFQVDHRGYLGEGDKTATDAFVIRRIRPILQAKLRDRFTLFFQSEFAGGTATVYDAWGETKIAPWLKIRAGKFKPPVGLERLRSAAAVTFAERSLASLILPNRDIGVQLHGEIVDGLVGYAVGVFNGGPDAALVDGDANDSKDLAGRLYVQPFTLNSLKRLGRLLIGGAIVQGKQQGSPKAAGLSGGKTSGQHTFFSYRSGGADTPGETTYASGIRRRLTVHGTYTIGPFGLLGEFARGTQVVQRDTTVTEVTTTALQAAVNVVVGGEASFDGARPFAPASPAQGQWGAVEIAARVSGLSIGDEAFTTAADPTKSARKATAIAGALNWLISNELRLGLTYERTTFSGGAPNNADRTAEQVLLARFQAVL